MMQPSSHSASTSLPDLPERIGNIDSARQHANLVYQTMTVAAVLILLGSLWLF